MVAGDELHLERKQALFNQHTEIQKRGVGPERSFGVFVFD